MTRNVYLGADLDRPLRSALEAQAAGGDGEQVLVALANAAHETRTVLQRTDFAVRARLIAAEIASAQPDLVGLQEMALWRSGPFDLGRLDALDAASVDHDYLATLLDALAALGAEYDVVQVGDRADVEVPCFTGSPFDQTIADASDVRITMRDAILLRRDAGLVVEDGGDRLYAANLEMSVGGLAVGFLRGRQWVDVTDGTASVRCLNTHLEAFSSDIALAQAHELLADVPADRTVVLLCDANSDPLDHTVAPGSGVPHAAAYELLTGTGGFTDEWLQWARAEEGWTSGLSETVDDETPAAFDKRIDFVLARAPARAGLPVRWGEVTGTGAADRDAATGLWPSDHGGVVVCLQRP